MVDFEFMLAQSELNKYKGLGNQIDIYIDKYIYLMFIHRIDSQPDKQIYRQLNIQIDKQIDR